MLPPEAMAAAEKASADCDLFFSIGTSTVVYPAADLPFVALRAGAVVVEVNPDVTPLTPQASYSLRGLAGEVLPALVKATWG
jgi:NAD-dependent deacetylase